MNLDMNDLILIEQALRERINQGTDYQKMLAYQGVLNKLQGMPQADLQMGQAGQSNAMQDGFRYDYDDNM